MASMAVPDAALIAAARALLPDVRAAADETERERQPVPAIIEKLLGARLFDLVKPRAIGGIETDLITMMRVIEEISIGDASIGWCVGIGLGTSIISGSVSEAVAREAFAPGTIQGGAFAPNGRGTVVEGGVRVSGRWPFVSGSPHCSTLTCGTLIYDGDAPRMLAAGVPDWRMPIFARKNAEIIDTWHTGGMRGTGSHDVAVRDLFVPDDHIIRIGGDAVVQPGPLYRFPIIGFLALTIAPVATGIARHAIDEVIELAQTKVALGTQRSVRERALPQHQIAEAEGELRAGRAFMYEAAAGVWDALERGDAVSMHQRAMVRLACVQATFASVRATDIAYRLGGGTAVYETSVLQRLMRDAHTVTQHVQLSANNYEPVGRVLFGLDPGTPVF
jgi:alkylation response protein AidB-like acyl-CoA dehydrogenase